MGKAPLPAADRPSRRTDVRTGLPEVFLHQGELVCTTEPTIIATILGSCVAVCLWDPVRRQAGMNHFLLPDGGGASDPRYGDYAVDALIQSMTAAGSLSYSLVAKVFGGAEAMAGNTGESVGKRNVDMALARLDAAGIAVVGGRTGGASGMQVRMDSETGDVWVRRVR